MTETELYQAGKRYQNFEEEYQPEVQAMEDAHIRERRVVHNMQIILRKCQLWPTPVAPWTDWEEGIYRGSWQAKYGFYRSWKNKNLDSGDEPLKEKS